MVNMTLTELDLGAHISSFKKKLVNKKSHCFGLHKLGNYVNTQGIATISEALVINTTLTWLDLGSN